MKILYLPIIEPGANHDVAALNKRGLYAALVRAGHWVTQWDYLNTPVSVLGQTFRSLVAEFKPDLLLTQLHGADRLTPDDLKWIHAHNPNIKIINWSGDSWLHSLTSETMVDLLRHVDLQLIAAPDVLPAYEALGIRAGFWQIAYEAPIGELPDMPAYDIVFLGNVINEKRRAMLEMLRTLPFKVGIYGDWEHADGRCTYDFGQGEALYKKARIAIADNVYVDQQNYISNRPIQCMMAGGAMLLHQHVDKMDVLSNGWVTGVHYAEWRDLDDLRTLINFWMHRDYNSQINRIDMLENAKEHCERYHTYDARVTQLFADYWPRLQG